MLTSTTGWYFFFFFLIIIIVCTRDNLLLQIVQAKSQEIEVQVPTEFGTLSLNWRCSLRASGHRGGDSR